MKQKWKDWRVNNSSTLIVWDFNTSLSIVDKITSQKINKEIEGLNHTTNQLYLTDIYSALHSKTEEYIFSRAHGTLSRLDQILDHKASFNTFKSWNQASSLTTVKLI